MAETGLLADSFQVSPVPDCKQQLLTDGSEGALKLVWVSGLCQAGAALRRVSKACLSVKNVCSEVERQHRSATAKYTSSQGEPNNASYSATADWHGLLSNSESEMDTDELTVF